MIRQKKYSPNNLPLGIMMLTGGVSASIAQILTIPLDTAKVRLQLQNGNGVINKYNGMIDCIKKIASQQGFSSLFKGLSAGIQRQLVFASLRIGLYEPVKQFYVGDKNNTVTIWHRILAALTTGAIGITVANPTDVVKIRFQAEGKKPINQQRYRTVTQAYKKIVAQQGVKGLWKGWAPNVIRNSIINVCQIATFDQVKDMLIRGNIMQDNVYCHIVSSSIAGFTACVVGSPVDVLKTRIMNSKPGQYSGIGDCLVKTMKEGPMAFYKGFVANAGRIISWNIAMFVTLGQVRKLVHKNCYNY